MVLTELLEFDRSGSVEVDLPENEGDFVDVREHAEKHHSLDPVAVKFDHEAGVGKSAEAQSVFQHAPFRYYVLSQRVNAALAFILRHVYSTHSTFHPEFVPLLDHLVKKVQFFDAVRVVAKLVKQLGNFFRKRFGREDG